MYIVDNSGYQFYHIFQLSLVGQVSPGANFYGLSVLRLSQIFYHSTSIPIATTFTGFEIDYIVADSNFRCCLNLAYQLIDQQTLQ